MFTLSKTLSLSALLTMATALAASAQQPAASPQPNPTPRVSSAAAATPEKETAKEEKKEEKKKTEKPAAFDPKNPTAEQLAETVIVVYGNNIAGREVLKQIRKTQIERGKLSITNADGTTESVNYERRILRGDSLDKERIRHDQESPSTKYALIYNDNKVVGLFNETVFTPREDASKAFQNQIWHGLDALLRYKENGSTVRLEEREKFMGLDYHTLEVTDKENRKTRFHVSAKSFRVMWLDYVEDDVKYVKRFYDYRLAQNTLVPYHTVLYANDKQIEDTQILTVTFGQKVEETAFQTS